MWLMAIFSSNIDEFSLELLENLSWLQASESWTSDDVNLSSKFFVSEGLSFWHCDFYMFWTVDL